MNIDALFYPSFIENLQAVESLHFWPELGIGYYPVKEQPYDAAYFDKYVMQANTDIGRKLNKHRVSMVNRHTWGPVLDIGIGCGTFIEARNALGFRTTGSDINPAGIEWLKARGLYEDAYTTHKSVTMWDVLEHIHNPATLLAFVEDYCFVSMPIYKDAYHVLGSKHFRKDEHCWYFTEHGLINFMAALGFDCDEVNYGETDIGRESIGSFVFTRSR